MATYREDRETLRKLAKSGLSGISATFIFALISHMRGKLHMRWYMKRHGGWRDRYKDYKMCLLEFNSADGWHCSGARLSSLADQAEWIKLQVSSSDVDSDLVERILVGYPSEDVFAPVAQELEARRA